MDLVAIQSSLSQRYRLGEELGRGGMAAVYRATDLRHGRDVALKILHPEMLGATTVERFLREIGVTARLTHPHILTLLDSGEAGGVPFYVMPLVSGESLHDRIAREGALPVSVAITLAAEIASALDFAHRQGIIHRDIKPENVLLQDGHAMVADFGIAKALSSPADTTALTGTGISIGTPLYMAPEQTFGEQVDARTDVYALGLVLYEMLTGSPPFHANVKAVVSRHGPDPVPSIRSVRPEVPAELERVVERALAKVPADRFSSAAEMREALLSAATLSRGATGARAPSAAAKPVVALAIIGVSLLVVLLATRGRNGNVTQSGTLGTNVASTRLAVLPMTNLSADTADAYFAAGMTEELISTLSDIGGVQVMARGAVMPYAGSTKPLGDVGRELGVGSLIESTIRKDGNRLRISVRLVDARTLEQRWSRQYDRELTDAFAIQRDVARSVAQALRVQLSGSESRNLNHMPTTNAAAYEEYLRGRIAMVEPFTAPRMEAAIAHLTSAVALDSNFALAHATLARAYVTHLFRFAPGPRYRNLASRAIDRALVLDSTLAEAYLARADLMFTPEAGWRNDDALRDHLHSLSLKPGLAATHAALGSLLFHIGLPREALRELRLAMSLDPSDGFSPPRVGRAFWYAQQYDSALVAFQRVRIPGEYALVLGFLGRERDGLAFLDSTSGPTEGDVSADYNAARAVLYARMGDSASARERIRRVERSPAVGRAHFHHAQMHVAMALARMGDKARAMQWLEQTAANGMPAFEVFQNDPHLALLRGYAPYERFMQRERVAYESRKAMLQRSETVSPP